ncbi:Putative bifunctional UDP-N-acetylglucosamine transferase and deubiquitinase ALG13 [Frankliniella fusca]|uniref:Bifunctional UDP-N-acetylglucosamine transferase and deubiquitinase ALG13 n=1 Tax=Frankliniella fusca TaxID=407009 RepID=A0AAE1HLQ0_9NEOP|nr:Putative bifunctional UDP-N-acetylglucosamine transferase and deubiquitinase ALG13 [Frankliniella fusca]
MFKELNSQTGHGPQQSHRTTQEALKGRGHHLPAIMAPSRQFANQPDPMDLWLETQGYYRKLTARDGSCLFRAIAEQVYCTQKFHLEVRKLCVDYLRDHLELFVETMMDTEIETYLEHLQNPTCWASSLEIIALSHLYNVDILIFKDVGKAAENIANTSYGRKIMLCASLDRHYDSVYLKEFTKTAGFCQSLVYEMLYKNVFGMDDVNYAVEKMLHYKPMRHRGDSGSSGSRKFFSYSCNRCSFQSGMKFLSPSGRVWSQAVSFHFELSSIQLQRKGIIVDAILDDGEVNVKDLLQKGVTPFPYKVAKSLDPNIYRNVEFDVWIDYRRGLRQGYFGSNNELQVGVKCSVKIEENTYVGHIQDMSPDKGPVVVFVEELGEKRTVPFENLELLPQEPISLKQVPLTYSRNSSVALFNKCSIYDSSCGSKKALKVFTSTGRRRTSSRSDQSSITDNDCDNVTRACVYEEANMATYTNYSVENFNVNAEYHSYQFKQPMEMGMSLPIQTHVLMSAHQHGNSQILIPVSPRPEDVPAHWLPTNSTDLSSDQTAEVPLNSSGIEPSVENSRDNLENGGLDDNANYLPDMNLQEPQINFNAPKSVLDDGADLPISDIQTLRFFYNLGNDVYRAQCSMQYGWGGYTQPCTVTSPSTPNPPGMCSAKCLCGPVCITTVPTIHRLLEPTTPPSTSRRRRKDSVSMNTTGGSEILSPDTPPNSQPSSATSGNNSTLQPNGQSRFKSKGRNKKEAKVLDGQHIVHQPTLQIPPAEETDNNGPQNTGTVNSDQNSPPLSVPYSPPYGYIYYPTSPVVPLSPVESDPYFSPLRLQFSTDYMPDTPQSPCFPVNGDLSVYGSSPQFPMMATSPHYLYPASPGIYVGSPPGWGPLTPTTPQPQS